MVDEEKSAWLPPRWFVRTAWAVHRGLHRVSGGRFLREEKPGKYGMMSVTTTGRRSGKERTVILAFLEDGLNLVTLAMNGWGEGDPAWWLNLMADPNARVKTPSAEFAAVAHAAEGTERERLWDLWRDLDDENLDAFAAKRSTETAVVVLEPRTPEK